MFNKGRSKPVIPKSIKRIISTLIAITLLITAIPITVRAGVQSGQLGGGGKGGMKGTTDYKAWSASKSGYRFYVINSSGTVISDLYDFTFTKPQVKSNNIFTFTRFDEQTESGYAIHTRHLYSMAKLVEWTGKVGGNQLPPYPTTSSRGQGELFRDWLSNGLESAQTSSGDSGSSGNGSHGTGDTYNPNVSGIISAGFDQAITIRKPIDKINAGKNIVNSRQIFDMSSLSQVQQYNINKWITSHQSAFNNTAKAACRTYADTSIVEGGYYAANMYFLLARASGFSKETATYMVQALYKGYLNSSLGGTVGREDHSRYRTQSTISKDLLSANIPLAGNASSCRLINLLYQSDFKVEGYATAYEALTDTSEECMLIIEPLVWLYPMTSPSGYAAAGNMYYGSYYNIAKFWKDNGGNKRGGFYTTYMTKLGNNCLQVLKNIELGDNGVQIAKADNQNQKDIEATINLIDTDKKGYSMHAYAGFGTDETADGSATHTWDHALGRFIGRAPDPSDLDEDTENGGKTIKIVKNYVTAYVDKDGNITNKVTDGNFSRTSNPHKIKIEDEPDYKVVDWRIGTQMDDKIYNGDSIPDWDTLVNPSITGQTKGYNITDTKRTPTVTLTSNEKTLYVELQRKEKPVENEGLWKLTQSKLSVAIVSGGSGGEPPKASVSYLLNRLNRCLSEQGHKYCALHFEKWAGCACGGYETTEPYNPICNGHWVDKNDDCANDGKCVKWEYTDKQLNFTRITEGTAVYGSATAQRDNKLIANNAADIGLEDIVTGGETFDRAESEMGATVKTVDYTYNFVLYRGPDQVTLCGYKPTGDGSNRADSAEHTAKGNEMATKLFQIGQVISNGNRLKANFARDMSFSLTESGNVDKKTAVSGHSQNDKGGCTITDSDAHAIGQNVEQSLIDKLIGAQADGYKEEEMSSEAAAALAEQMKNMTNESINFDPLIEGSAEIEVYSGQQRVPDTSISTETIEGKFPRTSAESGDKTQGIQVKSKGDITFTPYIRMTIQGLKKENGNIVAGEVYDVNVLSEWNRKIIPNDFAEIQWASHAENLKVNSNMWSMTAAFTNGTQAWNQPNQVLKGGAAYTLDTKESMQKVYVNTYQTIVDGESLKISRLNEGGSDTGALELTEPTAMEEHIKLVSDVTDTLDNLKLQLWASDGTSDTSKNAWNDPNRQAIKEDTSMEDWLSRITANKTGNRTSKESKYYLQGQTDNIEHQSQDSNRADMDVKAGDTVITYYRFYSDVYGDIYMSESDSMDGTYNKVNERKLLSKGQGVNNLADITAKGLEARTGVVTKLVAAIERNSGADSSASWASSDGHWYNEAYNGVTVMVQSTPIEVGIKNSQRMTVLDPKLTPVQNSKHDVDERTGKTITEAIKLQYKCAAKSSIHTDKNAGYVGQFKGTDVYMKNMDKLFTSKKFYAVNGTVSDNN